MRERTPSRSWQRRIPSYFNDEKSYEAHSKVDAKDTNRKQPDELLCAGDTISSAAENAHIGVLVCGLDIQYMYNYHSAIIIAHPVYIFEDEDIFLKNVFALPILHRVSMTYPLGSPTVFVHKFAVRSCRVSKYLDYRLEGVSMHPHWVRAPGYWI